MKSRNKLLIVDGYNILRSGSRYKHLRGEDDWTPEVFNKVREALINDVIAYMGRDYRRATIVFDGAGNNDSTGIPEHIGDVRIVFSPAGWSADRVIEKLAHDARQRGVEVMVVTSDAGIQDAVFGSGVDRMSAEGFSREVDLLDEESKLDHFPQTARKATIAQRIPSDVLEQLRRMRDGVL